MVAVGFENPVIGSICSCIHPNESVSEPSHRVVLEWNGVLVLDMHRHALQDRGGDVIQPSILDDECTGLLYFSMACGFPCAGGFRVDDKSAQQ